MQYPKYSQVNARATLVRPDANVVGRRCRLAMMFTDIVASTTQVVALGDEAWLVALRLHDDVLRAAFAATGGREVTHIGDGFFVVFDHPVAALECAVLIQRHLAAARLCRRINLHVRIGIQWAEVLEAAGTYVGRGVHEAARIADVTRGDEIVASAEAFRAARDVFSASEPRTVELRGLPEPLEVVSLGATSGHVPDHALAHM